MTFKWFFFWLFGINYQTFHDTFIFFFFLIAKNFLLIFFSCGIFFFCAKRFRLEELSAHQLQLWIFCTHEAMQHVTLSLPTLYILIIFIILNPRWFGKTNLNQRFFFLSLLCLTFLLLANDGKKKYNPQTEQKLALYVFTLLLEYSCRELVRVVVLQHTQQKFSHVESTWWFQNPTKEIYWNICANTRADKNEFHKSLWIQVEKKNANNKSPQESFPSLPPSNKKTLQNKR